MAWKDSNQSFPPGLRDPKSRVFPRRLPADGDVQSLVVIKEKSDEMAPCKINLARCFQLVIIIPRLASNASEKNFFSNASEKNSSLHFFGSPHFSDFDPSVGEVATPPARSRFFPSFSRGL